jgi:hypothetical protein
MQLYANIDEEDPSYHRMLYVFACLSPLCISDQRAIKVYRGYAKDSPDKFANEDEFDEIYNSTDVYLRKQGLLKEEEGQEESKVEEEDEKVPDEAEIKEKGLKFDEYSIETDIE